MTISFAEFAGRFLSDPILKITVVLILGVIFVNGFTDAPNAIASCVSTGAMEMREAVRMAAVCNLAGILFMSSVSTGVAFTIYHMVDFGTEPAHALTGLCAAMTSIIVWAAAAWCFGIPTSESHALIAGLSGAALAIHGGTGGINAAEWRKVLCGLLLSVAAGLLFGWLAGKTVGRSGREAAFFAGAQKMGAAAMAFMHGAQDGQKFMGVFLLGIFLAGGENGAARFTIPFWMMILCSLVMAAGTAVGGKRIIRTVGTDMVKLDKPQGFAADAAGALCLFLSSLAGIPVSTTHVKTAAMMGAGAAKDASMLNRRIVEEMFAAWILTFPGCGAIGYLTAKIFMR